MDLGGVWRACVADDEVRRAGIGLTTDDSAWSQATVPGHWRLDNAFADSDGPVLYRRRFQRDRPTDGERVFVTLHGVFYQADVWLDGAYLGDPEGYFMPHTFDITDLCRLADDHVLAIEVTCSPHRDQRAKRTLTGAYQEAASVDSSWNPGGLWQSVTIDTTGPVRIDRCRVICRDANATRAHLRLTTRLDSNLAGPARVTTSVDGQVVAEQELSLAAGTNDLSWNLDVDRPNLWWPWSLGEQPLSTIEVVVSVEGSESDRRSVRTGLREVAIDHGIISVNGERLFSKGVNLGPSRLDLAQETDDAIRRDVLLAREAGFDLIRCRGHIAPEPLYAATDDLGMLVWQDMVLVGGYARSTRRQAVEQARTAVDLLGHHPSIAVWCAHDTPSAGWVDQQLPNWNKTILDRWVKRAIEQVDESRPVIAASGVAPHLPQFDASATHLQLGWGRGDERDLPALAASLPRIVQFVSAFGAQSLPDGNEIAAAADAAAYPLLDWERLAEHHGADVVSLERHVPTTDHPTFEAWRTATQEYQARLARHHIEHLRRLKYRPTGGFCLSSLVDPAPMVSTSVLDHDRRPKPAFASVTDACRAVIVVADRLDETLDVGRALALDVHVVSDLRHPLQHAQCNAAISWLGGRHEWRWRGDIPADDCVRVGTIQFMVPDAPGEMRLDLTLDYGDGAATNRYETVIVRPAG
jgi:beta-mannosidase